MSEWRNIENAPKDGTNILLYAHAYRDYYGVGRWAEAQPDFGSVEGWFWSFAIRPTHWQPLPPPPESKP